MAKYEIMLLISGKLSLDKANELNESLNKSIKVDKIKVKFIGTQELAYPINNETIGHYYQINFDGDPQSFVDWKRLVLINKSILRHLIINLDKDYGSRAINNEKKVRLSIEKKAKYDQIMSNPDYVPTKSEKSSFYRKKRREELVLIRRFGVNGVENIVNKNKKIKNVKIPVDFDVTENMNNVIDPKLEQSIEKSFNSIENSMNIEKHKNVSIVSEHEVKVNHKTKIEQKEHKTDHKNEHVKHEELKKPITHKNEHVKHEELKKPITHKNEHVKDKNSASIEFKNNKKLIFETKSANLVSNVNKNDNKNIVIDKKNKEIKNVTNDLVNKTDKTSKIEKNKSNKKIKKVSKIKQTKSIKKNDVKKKHVALEQKNKKDIKISKNKAQKISNSKHDNTSNIKLLNLDKKIDIKKKNVATSKIKKNKKESELINSTNKKEKVSKLKRDSLKNKLNKKNNDIKKKNVVKNTKASKITNKKVDDNVTKKTKLNTPKKDENKIKLSSVNKKNKIVITKSLHKNEFDKKLKKSQQKKDKNKK